MTYAFPSYIVQILIWALLGSVSIIIYFFKGRDKKLDDASNAKDSIFSWVENKIKELRIDMEKETEKLCVKMDRIEEKLEKKIDEGFKDLRHYRDYNHERDNQAAANKALISMQLEVIKHLENINKNGK